MAKSKVAVLRVTPDTILSDIDRLVELGGVGAALAAGKTTILKDNISWHFPFPAANTTPWQLEGDTPQLLAYAVETGSAHGQADWEEVLAPRRARPNATTCADEDNPAHWWEQPS